MIQTSSAVMQLFKGSYFNVATGSRHLWPYSNDNAGSLETVLKLSHLPLKFRFSGKCLCFEKPLGREHFPAIFQPPGDVYLLNIELESFEYVLQITQLATKEICPEMHALAKMAEMAINRQNRQTINKNSNEMAKGPFAKWRFRRKWRIWRKWQKWQLIAKIAKL